MNKVIHQNFNGLQGIFIITICKKYTKLDISQIYDAIIHLGNYKKDDHQIDEKLGKSSKFEDLLKNDI